MRVLPCWRAHLRTRAIPTAVPPARRTTGPQQRRGRRLRAMRPIIALAVACLLAWLPATSHAQALYKCRGPDGALSYQDHECAPDAEDLVPPPIAPPPRDPYVPE